jgi:hydroxymethylglutaryl-CoA synthase
MVGITAYGAYIPRYRLKRKKIFESIGWFNAATAGVARGEKAIANFDEDSITMSVAAAMDCLNGLPRHQVDGLYLSSMSLPYVERQNAAICASALAFRSDIRTADFGASAKAGTTALLAACEAVQAGNRNNFLVCAADLRLGKPGSNLEHLFGDGAAALLVGRENVMAELKTGDSFTDDFPDIVRGEGQQFPRTWEERWVREEGYQKIIPRTVGHALQKWGLAATDVAKAVIACPNSRVLMGIGKKLGFSPKQIQDPLLDTIGDTGAALPLMMLVAALESARPGDKILVVSYGTGGDALLFEATDQVATAKGHMGVTGHLNLKKNLEDYTRYLVFRGILPVEVGIRGEDNPFVRFSSTYRMGDTISSLRGSRCTACGTPQYPKQRVCINPSCGAIDQMEDYYFYDKVGRINSYTGDNLAFAWNPPGMYGLVDFEEGGRLYLDFTDCDLSELKVGKAVRLSFRRRFVDKQRGIIAYFWKAVPLPDKEL